MKRKLSILFAAIMLLSGCSSASAPAEITTAQATEAETAEITTAQLIETEAATETSSAEEIMPVKIELSGNNSDEYYIEKDCYAETERAVFYFQKGITVKGDILVNADMIMDDLCEVSGYSFDIQPDVTVEPMEYLDYFDDTSLANLNPDHNKVNILLVELGDNIQWAWQNYAVLEPADLDFNDESICYIAYHELSHVLHLNNGVNLGRTLTEGFAELTVEKARKKKGMHIWTLAQYYYPTDTADGYIMQGESGFDYALTYAEQRHYCYEYGFKFLKYITDVYGDDAFDQILAKATEQDYSASFDPENEELSHAENTEQLKKIIKSVTSDDVFENFPVWYEENHDRIVNEFCDYMASIGQPLF